MKIRSGFLKETGFNLLFWIIASNLYVIFRYFGIDEFYVPKYPRNIGTSFIEANSIAILIGLLLSLVDLYMDKETFKRRSFRYITIVTSLAYTFMMLFSIISLFALHGLLISNQRGYVYLLSFTFFSLYTVALLIYGFLMSMLLNFIKQVNKKFGPGVLWKLFSGKYHEPRQENRIFMFLDLKSSTTIAEKLGHLKYSGLIQDCFYDITAIVTDYKAEIYQYVGDEIVLTWEIEKGIEKENCFHFYFAFKKLLCEKEEYYTKKFGIVPEFKAGMNCGYVTVAEIGEIKKEIAYHGDVLNTAARIQNQCNYYNKDLLVSHEIHRRMPRFEGFKGELIGEVLLKGKHIPTGLYSLEMAV